MLAYIKVREYKNLKKVNVTLTLENAIYPLLDKTNSWHVFEFGFEFELEFIKLNENSCKKRCNSSDFMFYDGKLGF